MSQVCARSLLAPMAPCSRASTLQLAPMSVNFRWTPPAEATFDTVGCSVVNISDVPKTIHIELKKSDGTNEAE